MKKFSIKILKNLNIWYNHYLSPEFIHESWIHLTSFRNNYPLWYCSRSFDKPAMKCIEECNWFLDDKDHRVGKPACIYYNGDVEYWENGELVK